MTRASPRSAESQEAESKLRSGACTIEENRFCADCGTTRPEFICLTLGTFICRTCAEIHRGMSNRLIKDLYGGTLTFADVRRMENVGNEVANRKFLATWDPREYPEPAVGDREGLREYIWLKYEGSWTRKMERERLHGKGDERGRERGVVRGREAAIFTDGGLAVRSPAPAGVSGRRSYWAEKFDKGDAYERGGQSRRRDDGYYGEYEAGRGRYDERPNGFRERMGRGGGREWERDREVDLPGDRYRDNGRESYQEPYRSRGRSQSRERQRIYSSDEDERPRTPRSSETKRGKRRTADSRTKKKLKKRKDVKSAKGKKEQYATDSELSSEEDHKSSSRRRSSKKKTKSSSAVNDEDSDEATFEAARRRKSKATKKSSRHKRHDDDSEGEVTASEDEYTNCDSEGEEESGSESDADRRKGKRQTSKKKSKSKEKLEKEDGARVANGFGNMKEHKEEFDLMSDLMERPKHGAPQSSQLAGPSPILSAPPAPPSAQMTPVPPVSSFPGMPMGMMMMPGPNGQMMMAPPMQPGMAFPQPMILPNGAMMMPMMPQPPLGQSMPMMSTMPNGILHGMQNLNVGTQNGNAPRPAPGQQNPGQQPQK